MDECLKLRESIYIYINAVFCKTKFMSSVVTTSVSRANMQRLKQLRLFKRRSDSYPAKLKDIKRGKNMCRSSRGAQNY